MRRLFGWMAGLAGVAALARLLSRRSHAERSDAPAEDGPARALRDKLSAARARPEPSQEPDASEPVDAPESLEERRARIHAKAQAAIDAMQEPDQTA